MSALSCKEVWSSLLSYEEFVEFIDSVVDSVEEFQLIFKLSDGGIVTRAIRPSAGEGPFFGRLERAPKRLQVWMVQRRGNENITAYQPICKLLATPQQAGTLVELGWAPHADIDRFNVIYRIGSAACLLAGVVGIQANPLAWIAVFLSPVVWLFPDWRGRSAFEVELRQAKSALADLDIWIASK